ncbi:hypothetical protein JKP88DRAFT_251362 [Tribonema minus]|uniref:Uncharacterized protein n=1 Tax=Tribonema minus TaxID=303371 RepID=A0A835ZG97_9STRA|nr:hypothetical protein JKP88DRAFT_251362 [Tribonema minus]
MVGAAACARRSSARPRWPQCQHAPYRQGEAAASCCEWRGRGRGGSSGGGGGSVSSRASDAAAEEDIDVFDEIADAAVNSIDPKAADAAFEDESEEKVGERFGKLGISSRNGPEARSRGSTIQQATQLLRSGDEVGALLSDQRVEPVQSDSDRAQLANVICAQVCRLSGEMRTALRGRLLERELVCVSLEAPTRTGGSGRGRAAQAGTQDGVWVDLLMLLRALFVEHCALNGVFWDRAADGSLQEAVGVRTVVHHEHCAQGKLPWMQVLIPLNRTRRRPIQACKVVVASAVLGGLTAAKPVATGAQYQVTGTLDIMPAGGVAGSRAKAKAPASTTGQKRKARSSDAGIGCVCCCQAPRAPIEPLRVLAAETTAPLLQCSRQQSAPSNLKFKAARYAVNKAQPDLALHVMMMLITCSLVTCLLPTLWICTC